MPLVTRLEISSPDRARFQSWNESKDKDRQCHDIDFSVHCELLGNTPNQRGNFRDEQARARLRKKLEKRKQASGQPLQCPDTKCQHKCDGKSLRTQSFRTQQVVTGLEFTPFDIKRR